MAALVLVVIILLFHPITYEETPLSGHVDFTGSLEKQEIKDNQTILTVKGYLYSNDKSDTINAKSGKDNQENRKTNNERRFQVITDGEVIYPGGCNVQGAGKIMDMLPATNPGEFDARQYYLSLGISYRIKGEVAFADVSDANAFLTFLQVLKNSLKESIDMNSAGDEDAGVLESMLLGDKSELSQDVKILYQMAGIAHIISISGLHMSIIGMGLYKLLRRFRLSRTIAGAVAVPVIISFGIMTGSNVATIRAVVMFVIMIGAEILGKSFDAITALSIALLFIALDNPYCIYNSGFLMSFVTILGITVFTPAVMKRFKTENRIVNMCISGLSIQIFGLPIILYNYYEMPVFAFLLNLIIIPLSGALLVSGLLGAFAGMAVPVIGQGILMISHGILWVFRTLCELSLQLPFANIIVGKPRLVQIALYYILLLVGVKLLNGGKEKKEQKKPVIKLSGRKNALAKTGSFMLLYLVALLVLTFRSYDDFSLTVLDVGQGDSIFAAVENDFTMLTDCGSSSRKNVGQYVAVPFLKSQGIGHLDYLFLTHPDNDHINGAVEVINSDIRVNNLIIGYGQQNNESYEEVLSAAAANDVNVIEMKKGDKLSYGELTVRCLNPDKNGKNNDSNDSSIVLEGEYGDFDFLLTGDLEGDMEDEICSELSSEEYGLLKVAHHGSKNSTTKDFLQRVNPETAVISVGRKNMYGHPHADTLKRLKESGAEIISTAETGAVCVEYNAKKLLFYTYAGDRI